MIISVIVCTRNRCGKLPLLLNSLDALIIPHELELEILIIDNGSTDATREVCEQYSEGRGQTFRYIFEGRKGKSFALNRGICEAKGDVLAFTDDDCVVDQAWAKTMMELYSTDAELSVLGGKVDLYDERDRPMTLVTIKEVVVLSSSPSMFFKPLIIGANMSFRKVVADVVGDFDVLLGPGSRAGAVAEDMDYVYRAYRKGFKVVYDPSLVVFHNHGRQTEEEERAVMYRYKVGRGAFYFKYVLQDRDVARRLGSDLKLMLTSAATSALRCKLPRFETRVLVALSMGALSRLSK